MHRGIPKTSPLNSNSPRGRCRHHQQTWMTDMDEEESLEEVPIAGSDMRISVRGTREISIRTPERLRRKKRRGDPDDMEDGDSKSRRFNSETEEGKSMPPDDQPDTKLRKLDEQMMDRMTEIDRKILASAILGVDITEVYSPERVA